MKVAFFGTPEFALPTLMRLLESRHQVLLVVSKQDRPIGRHQELTPPPVAILAERRGLTCEQPKSVRSPEFAERLAGLDLDAAVVVAFGRLIPEELLSIPRFGFVNLHPSLLPRHRGPSPIQWALVCGDRVTGVTTMQIDADMDTGPILLQETVRIEPKETADELAERLAARGAELVVETLDRLEAGKLVARAQPQEGASVSPMLRRSFAKVDWTMPARALVNRLRGLTSWPGMYTKFRGGRLKIHGLEEVQPAPRGDEEPGTVIAADGAGIVVRAGRGTAVRITDLQREGRRRLPADAFLIGERVSRGEQFS
jgi:methionyl-tRNA formyltransferase